METRARTLKVTKRTASPAKIRRKKSKNAADSSTCSPNGSNTDGLGLPDSESAEIETSGVEGESEEQLDSEIEELTAQIEARKQLLENETSNAARLAKKMLRDDLVRQLQDLDESASSSNIISQNAPGQKTFLDKDGKCYIYHEKTGVVADLEASQAFRRVCEDSRHRILLKRGDGMRLESDHVRDYFILHCELLSSSSHSKDLLSTVSLWKSLSNLPVCTASKFSKFLSFRSVMYNYDVLSLQDFIATGAVESDYATLAMALQNMEDLYCCVFGESWSGFCSGIIRQLKTDTLIHRRSIQFIRYQLEQVYWVFSYDMTNFHFDPSQHDRNYANTEDCVSQFVMLLSNLQLESDDESYFNRFILPKLAHNMTNKVIASSQSASVPPIIKKTVQFAPVRTPVVNNLTATTGNNNSQLRICLANMLHDLQIPQNGRTVTPCKFGAHCKYDHVRPSKDISESLLKTLKSSGKKLSPTTFDAATTAIATLS